jgi:hypothetical protein
MAFIRNPEVCLRRLLYSLDDSNSLIINDQKFTRSLTKSHRQISSKYGHILINTDSNASTLSGGTETEYCSILAQVLQCTPISPDLFRNNMKKHSRKTDNLTAPGLCFASSKSNSQTSGRINPVPSMEGTARLSSVGSFHIQRRSGDRLQIERGSQKSDDSSSSVKRPPSPPPLSVPFEFTQIDIESDFSVAPLPEEPTAVVKAKFSISETVECMFKPEPLFDADLRVPAPLTGRIERSVVTGDVPVVTRKTFASKVTTVCYPFLKMPASCSHSSESVHSSSGNRKGSHGHPPKQSRSFPGSRRMPV